MNKSIIKENGVSEELIENEINLHSKFIHDNIIRLYSYHVTSDAYYLVNLLLN
jgi:serine/threonine protein kinase